LRIKSRKESDRNIIEIDDGTVGLDEEESRIA